MIVIGNPIQCIESSNDSEAEMKREISAASPHNLYIKVSSFRGSNK